MSEPENNEQKPEVDAFGQSTKEPEPPKKEDEEGEEGEEDKDKKGKGKKKTVEIPDDHPLIVSLRTEIDKVKKEYGDNLSGQRKVIEELQGQLKEFQKGGGKKDDEEGAIFKEIKRSKDLTAEQKEEMTETEMKQMDVIAELQEGMNKLAKDFTKKEKEKGEEAGKEKTQNLDGIVKAKAKALATKDGAEDTELANQIIEMWNTLHFDLAGLDKEGIEKRVEMAAKEVSDYKPPKEQEHKPGKPPKNTKDKDDPFGTNQIVEEATKGSDGKYAL